VYGPREIFTKASALRGDIVGRDLMSVSMIAASGYSAIVGITRVVALRVQG
jgi:hypothetical protein